MAGASMKDIKARMKSVSSTMQITKAMELVATSKLRKAKERLERSRPFHETLLEAIGDVEAACEVRTSIWSTPTEGGRTLFIVIAGDRGLAGGYNSNVFRTVEALSKDKDALYLPIGKKAIEYCRNKEKAIYSEAYEYVDDITVGATLEMGESISRGFKAGEFDRVEIIYTAFVSMLTQTPKSRRLLPIEEKAHTKSASSDPIYLGDPEEILDSIVPEYLGGVIYFSVCESCASELGARRTAMDSANKNASEIIDTLTLQFNRARQAVITQEITEIVSGSEAL